MDAILSLQIHFRTRVFETDAIMNAERKRTVLSIGTGHSPSLPMQHTPLRSADPTTPALASDAPSQGALIEGCATAAEIRRRLRALTITCAAARMLDEEHDIGALAAS